MSCPFRAPTLRGNVTQGAAALALGYAVFAPSARKVCRTTKSTPHFIGIFKGYFCVLSEYKKVISSFYRNFEKLFLHFIGI